MATTGQEEAPMGNAECYEAKLPEILAIKDENILTQRMMAIATYLQEAEDLYKWCLPDKATLVKTGLDWSIAEDIPIRAAALREAYARCVMLRASRKETGRAWREKAKELFDLRGTLLHHFGFAYQDNPRLKEKIKTIGTSNAYAAIIQDLNDLSVLGKTHSAELRAHGIDMSLLDRAAAFSRECADLLASTTLVSAYDEAVKIRNKAFTLLKLAVDKVYRCGRYAFWKNKDRLRGYASARQRLIRQNRPGSKKKPGNDEGKQAGA